MNKKNLDKLDYFDVINNLKKFCTSNISKNLCENLIPKNNYDDVFHYLCETNETSNFLRLLDCDIDLYIYDNIDVTLNKLKLNSVLNIKEIYSLGKILKQARQLKNIFFENENIRIEDFKILSKKFEELYSNNNLENNIFSKLLDENTIDDKASNQLYSIRCKKRELELNIKEKLNKMVHSPSFSKYIQDSVITLKNDRYVIPIKEEYRSHVNGFIHDISSSGSTLFIEPISIFDMNNSINTLKSEEENEIQRILEEFSKVLSSLYNEFHLNVEIISYFDLLCAKAKYSTSISGIMPHITKNKEINLIKAYHPLINRDSAVPININLGINYSCLVITGPNTGGKTVTLKTVRITFTYGLFWNFHPC